MANAVSKSILVLALSWPSLGILSAGVLMISDVPPAQAQVRRQTRSRTRRPVRRRDTGQDATVVVDGSAVYEAPNFDSPVKEYLDRGKRIRISKRIYKGAGGLGAFYKVRLRPRIYGYITDVDISIDGRSGVEVTESAEDIAGDPTRIQPDIAREDEETRGNGGTFYLTRFLGLSYSTYNYTEKLNNSKQSANTPLIGVKMTGPGTYMGGLPIDYELMFTTSAPDFYNKIASSASGMMLIGHARATFPLIEQRRYYFYYGFGPVLRYSKFDVKLKNQTGPAVDSQEIALGLDLAAGLALQVTPKVAVRFEGAYVYENETYFGFGGALQFRY